MEDHTQAHWRREHWLTLDIGQDLMVVKRDPDGKDVARYPAVVVARTAENDWVAVRASWAYQRIEIDGLEFAPGDDLVEWFSPHLPFNAFAVLNPAGELRGWYANVTYPAFLELARNGEDIPTLVWHDLYLDLVGLPDATFVLRDEDELAESGLAHSNPRLHSEIVAASEELVRRFTSRRLPFRLLDPLYHSWDEHRQSQNESV